MSAQNIVSATEELFLSLGIINEDGTGNLTISVQGLPRKWTIKNYGTEEDMIGEGPTLKAAMQDLLNRYHP